VAGFSDAPRHGRARGPGVEGAVSLCDTYARKVFAAQEENRTSQSETERERISRRKHRFRHGCRGTS
jgi:hypothetical protein